ncbi:ELMO domain-containing protein 2 [Amblyraja radiata]|uniref:ELMO domain-containing protein 2 n=1 Tax=Amblyraja radiata TaxID=386614 RepID=UPI0014023B24|nr:ELMO domain-containing protein 2 [Amblyraja radiata]
MVWIQYAHNSLPNSATGLSPFHCSLGYQPPLFSDQEEESPFPLSTCLCAAVVGPGRRPCSAPLPGSFFPPCRFKLSLQICLLQVTGYKKLFVDVENLRKQPFDSSKKQHEDMLIKLWELLMPHIPLESRITKQWGDIGFQGEDPKTDFRGMGMLGLHNLMFFGEHYPETARQALSQSNHPKMGYSYAIVGINLTEMAYSMLKTGILKTHLYNVVSGAPQMHHFHEFYCYLMYEFNQFWFKEKPASIMEFNYYREQFHKRVKELLLDHNSVLILKAERQ